MSWKSAVDDLRRYFTGDAVVCPYARAARCVFFEEFGEVSPSLSNWAWVLNVRDVAVIIASDGDALSHAEAGAWCLRTLARIRCTIGAEEQPIVDGRRQPHIRPRLINSLIDGQVFYAIGMGPQYPERHPRWAPHLCIVAVNEAEIAAVPRSGREPVWKAIVGRIGKLYNPDEVWLALESAEETRHVR